MPTRPQTPHPTVDLLTTGHFDEDEGYATWRDAGTRDWLLIHTLGGRGRFGYDGGELSAEPGDIILIRPGVRHDYGVEPVLRRWELLWTHFHPRPHWLPWLDWPQAAPGLHRLQLPPGTARDELVQRFFDCHHLARGAGRRRQEWAMNVLEEVLLRCDALNPRHASSRVDERIQEAMEFLCQNLAGKITLGAMADAVGLSPSRLSHLFRQQTGVTPQQYLEQQRLERAMRLLELTSLSIKQIARRVGFESPYYFSLRFKRWKNISPARYRNAQGRISAKPDSGS
jgi:AraC family transcriptional regulator of arabinose operon